MPTTAPATTFFVIATQDDSHLVTSVFTAGRNEEEQAVLVFTDEAKATIYLQAADWLQTETVAALKPDAFLRCLLDWQRKGVDLIVIDADRVHQEDGVRQTVQTIEGLLASLGLAISDALTATDFSDD